MSDFAGSPMNRTYGNATTRPIATSAPDAERESRPRRPELDPGEEGDDEQRSEEEQVPVLDAVGCETRRERRHHERRGDDERDRRREVLVEPGGELPRTSEQDDERHDRHDPDVERELLDMPEPEAERLVDVVPAFADDAVRAEEVGDRAPAGKLDADHEQPEPDDASEQREEGADRSRISP